MDHRNHEEDYPESPSGGPTSEDVLRERDHAESLPDAHYAGADLIGVATDILGAQLRDRPIPTLLAAVAAGWLLGKILR